MANKNSKWQDHFKRTDRYGVLLQRLYDATTEEISRLVARHQLDPTKQFIFEDYPALRNQADVIFRGMAGQMLRLISTAQGFEYEQSNLATDQLVRDILSKTNDLNPELLSKYMNHNLEALKTFQDRRISGLKLSERIWKLTQAFKAELELGVSAGLGEGRAAKSLATEMKQYLIEPNKLFRRVRDKFGKLQLSKAAKAYNPGPGIYRSSYRNSLRMTRTEANMAFRMADHERFQQLDFVVGFEVKRSNNITECDVCEPFKGFYPKTFVFRGWHPQCRCFIVSILANRKEINELEEMLLEGKSTSGFKSENTVKQVPQGFIDYLTKNKERILKAKSTPYWFRDNLKNEHLKNLKLG